tara:strand:+ start:126 stop:533 length:408 start_codon:yes stop_codon:yes gene_type:complete
MNRDKLKDLYEKYNLTKDDIFKHQHYVIITRTGIEKIEAQEKIHIVYKCIKSEPNFAVVQAFGTLNDKQMETFGSAYKGATFKEGNTNTWYVTEMAEKRAFSRVVLKLTGFYALGVFGEDESEDFKKQKVNIVKE